MAAVSVLCVYCFVSRKTEIVCTTWGRLNMKRRLINLGIPIIKDKTILRTSHLYNENPHIWKDEKTKIAEKFGLCSDPSHNDCNRFIHTFS